MKGFSLFLNRWLPVGFWVAFVIYASTNIGSGENSGHFLRSLLAWFHPDFGGTSIREINFFTRKSGHVIQFFVYAVLLWRGLRLSPPVTKSLRETALLVLGTAAFLAVLSECIQLFSSLRSAQIADVGLDVAGAMIGLAVILTLASVFKRRPPGKTSPPAPNGRPAEKILITSDLHLDQSGDRGREVLEKIPEKT